MPSAFFEQLMSLAPDHTLATVSAGTAILGVVSGALGCFALLRKQSLMGDVVAHASLPGIVLAFLAGYWATGQGHKDSLLLMAGAATTGLLAMFLVSEVTSKTRLKNDSALGVMLAIFFGSGVFLLKLVEQRPIPGKSGLSDYVFGSAATLTTQDVRLMAVLGAVALGLLFLFRKEFKLHTFDPAYAASLGFDSRVVERLLTSVLVLAIVIGLQAVGVVLMVAMVVAPAAAARQWTDRLSGMVSLAAFFGASSGVAGAWISSAHPNWPTGPTIVLVASTFVLLSLLLAPRRGMLAKLVRLARTRRKVRLNYVLVDLLLLEANHPDRGAGHGVQVLMTMHSRRSGIRRSLGVLGKLGLVHESPKGSWHLTPKGIEKARQAQGETFRGD